MKEIVFLKRKRCKMKGGRKSECLTIDLEGCSRLVRKKDRKTYAEMILSKLGAFPSIVGRVLKAGEKRG